jgi:hypothetical protein
MTLNPMNEITSWIMSFMVSVTPLGEPVHITAAQETPRERIERYEEITQDLVEVVFDEYNDPLFEGSMARTHTVAVMLGIMRHESRFLKHIDLGLGTASRGDSGKSWCMMQVMAGRHGTTGEWNIVHDRPPHWGDPEEEIVSGVTGQEMVQDRKLCFREGLRIARWSFSRCGNRGPYERLRVYASGSCSKGGEASRARMWSAERFWRETAEERTWTDAQIMEIIEENRKAALDHNFVLTFPELGVGFSHQPFLGFPQVDFLSDLSDTFFE